MSMADYYGDDWPDNLEDQSGDVTADLKRLEAKEKNDRLLDVLAADRRGRLPSAWRDPVLALLVDLSERVAKLEEER